ncbi:hypothetical protein KC909_01735 [Candidatus Dojkabacteria bacterium]|uniref:Uncharacterized protein n=1 Tax=Candidatus Dojkabacteria bacterium TaxID=2099670 RepID=A0A955L4W3_9BACT|nr:hypothetical protein [Candidatus Dojkabacteria bacterium]
MSFQSPDLAKQYLQTPGLPLVYTRTRRGAVPTIGFEFPPDADEYGGYNTTTLEVTALNNDTNTGNSELLRAIRSGERNNTLSLNLGMETDAVNLAGFMQRMMGIADTDFDGVQPFVHHLISNLPNVVFSLENGIRFTSNGFIDEHTNYIPDGNSIILNGQRIEHQPVTEFRCPFYLLDQVTNTTFARFGIAVRVEQGVGFSDIDMRLRELIHNQQLTQASIRTLLSLTWSVYDFSNIDSLDI